MAEEIRVHVVDRGRKFLAMRFVDPLTGRKVERSTGVKAGSKAQRRKADKVAAVWEAELRDGRYQQPSKVTWAAFRERYEDEVVGGLADRTADKIASTFNLIEEIIGPDRLAQVNADRLARFQMVFRNRSRSENTLKGHLAHLLAALRWAKRIGLLVTIPEIDMPKRAKRSKQMKGRPITTEEFERLLGKVSQGLVEAGKDRTKKQKPQPQLRRRQVADIPAEVIESWTYYLRGLWWSGLRLEESLKLYWDRDDRLCVDLTGKFPMLRIPAELEKGHRDRLLPIAPEFAEHLFATPECERTGRVFKPMAIRPGAPLPKAHRVGEIASAIQRQRRCDDCNTGEVGERGLARLETADKTPAGWGRFQIRKFYESE